MTNCEGIVCRLLAGSRPAAAVIALTDVYTGSQPPEFQSADDAKTRMREWVGPNPSFYPHVALHDFEAWLLPYWEKIKKLSGSNRSAPAAHPETVNHMQPPSRRLEEVFRTGGKGRAYVKVRDAGKILLGEDLSVAAGACPELQALIDTIVSLCK